MKEIWKDILGYESLYQVSSYGNTRSLDRTFIRNNNKNSKIKHKGRILKQRINNKGYYCINLTKDNKLKTYTVHRLVIKAFVINQHNKKFTNHKDGNKLNNFVENLEWVTPKENTQHAYDTGLKVAPNGENSGRSKLTEKEVLEIRKMSKKYKRKEMAKKYGVSESQVYRILNKSVWKHI